MAEESQEVQLTEVEQQASTKGWKPEKEWDSTKGRWRPAQEFLDRGELFDKISSLKSEIYNLKKDYNLLADHHRKVSKIEYEKALKTLKSERTKAAEEGDTAAVVKLSEQIDELKDTQADTPPIQSQPILTQQMEEWVGANPWYRTDPELRVAADALGQAYVANNPGVPFEKVLDYVGKRVVDLHPEKFPSKSKSKPSAPTVEGTTNAPASGPSSSTAKSKQLRESDLSEDERKVMRTLIQRKAFGNITETEAKKKYLDELAAVRDS